MKYISICAAFVLAAGTALAGKPATQATKEAQAQVLASLPFDNTEDFNLAKRGLIARPDPLIIKGDNGEIIWDMSGLDYLNGPRPDTVNPSLWRQAQLNAIYGLFQVTDRIYQIRGFDLANMTLIEGDTGWIIVDPLTATETVRAAMEVVDKHFGKRPIKAILSTHSHVDHFGGIRALANEEDLASGKIRFVAPAGFVEEAASENVIAGNAMGRRATYMFGNLLPPTVQGNIDSGLGKGVAFGTISLLTPTDVITATGQKLVLDGVTFEFQNVPGAEAPAEFIFYLPEFKALCLAEEVNAVMHNLYTPRGAKTRDALIWSRHLTDTLELFGDRMDLAFGSHHWPRWGREEAFEYISKQRDMYRFMHDQTVRLMNSGYTSTEISNILDLPPSLRQEFYNRDYYGTVSHNVRAVYNFYLGYFDAVPANLNPLAPAVRAEKYVALAGGSAGVMAKAQTAFDTGEYRWVAELLNHLVFADPDNEAAKNLLADAYEQMGYQAESGPWRNFYLTGAQELRRGILKPERVRTVSPDLIASVPTFMFLDCMGVRFDPEDADDLKVKINLYFTDTGEQFVLSLENSVLNNIPGKQDPEANASLKLTRALFNSVALGETNFAKEIVMGNVKFSGNPLALTRVFGRLQEFDPWFNIV
ncbi:MAG: alkyl sulfatase dimerization domain-containing protein, partial [Pseudomonadota bacterium]|nr:alkyl sulfatase dimerization domain-containing protein [Pseudomonadota bacterium]